MTKKLLLFIVTLFSLQIVSGQISFHESVIDSTKYEISKAYAVDFDGDGDQDLVYESSPFSWSKNTDSAGTMGVINVIDASISVNTLKIGDLDNDGDLDLVILGYNSITNISVLAWYENTDGLGNFGNIQTISTNSYNDLDINDFDGDSKLDIIISSKFDGKIAWYKNLGSGAFGTEQLITNASTSSSTLILSITTGDIDNDNDIDIVYAPYGSPDQSIYWIENTDGNGAFTTTNLLLNVFGGMYDINLIDFNQDGVLDLYGSSSFDNIYLKNDGIGIFTWEFTFNSSYENSSLGKAIDIDGDSDMDMLYFVDNFDTFSNNNNEGAIIWFENTDGLGTFSTEQIIRQVNFTSEDVINNAIAYLKFNTADLNGDGYQDLVCSGLDGYEVSWFQNENNSVIFGNSKSIINDITGINYMQSADIDSDGDEDVVFVSGLNDTLGWFENLDGNGVFGPQQIISVQGNKFSTLKIADVDSNGSLDIIVNSSLDDKIWIYKNTDGLGNFTLHQSIVNSSGSSRNMNVFDVDNDSHIDIVMLENFGDKLVWFKNIDGLGNFGTEQIITEAIDDLDDYKFSDLDNDGDLDIVINTPFSWLENLGSSGNFSALQNIQTSENIRRLKTYDVDSDGDNDILVYFNYELGWFENTNGQANFANYHSIDNTFSTYELLIDIDNDGDLDVVNQNYSSATENKEVNLYRNDQGNFSGPINIDESNRFSALFAGNLDGNDKNDIIYSVSESSNKIGKIGWYRNLGVLENQISGSVTYDFNNDGCDISDIPANNTLVAVGGNGFSFATFSQPDGTFQLDVSQGQLYTYLAPNTNFTSTPDFFISEFTNVGEVDNSVDFCLTAATASNDLNIVVYPSVNDPRPGFDTTYQIVYNNVGTTQLSGDVAFQFDDAKLNFLNASETVTSQTINTLTFNFTDLNPFETRTIDLEFNVFAPPTTNIDDVLVSTATVNPVTGDNTADDNVFTLNQTVIGSYDPNDIRVLEGDQILLEDADKYLHYIIRFQNTGTASAINLNVENVLDSKLDWTTIQLESLSHNGRVEITNGNLVNFVFDDINLVNSTSDEVNSHGFIAYKIKPKTNVVVGDIFNSTADIYFDFNPAIVTNTVTTEIVASLSVGAFETTDISIFPNPANKELTIKGKTIIESITIYDINGRQLKTVIFTSEKGNLDISNLSQGMYFLKIKSGNNTESIKFIKK